MCISYVHLCSRQYKKDRKENTLDAAQHPLLIFFHCILFPVSLQRKPVDYSLALSICHDSIPSCVWNKRDRKTADVTNAKKSFKRVFSLSFRLITVSVSFFFPSVDFTPQWCNRVGKKNPTFFSCTEWVAVWWVFGMWRDETFLLDAFIGDDIVMPQLNCRVIPWITASRSQQEQILEGKSWGQYFTHTFIFSSTCYPITEGTLSLQKV